MIRGIIRTLIPAAAIAALALSATAAGAATSSTGPVARTHTVTTRITLQPDSGVSGDTWGEDTFDQTVTVTRSGGTRGYEYVDGKWKPYPTADCGGSVRCFHYTFSMALKGHTTTVVGQVSPGDAVGGTVLDVAENVALTGTASGSFYSSYKRYYTADVPAKVEANETIPVIVNGFNTTSNYGYWAVLGQPGAHIASVGMPDWSFKYVAAKGSDSQCPAYTGTWTDAAAGSTGNILAPDIADCAAQS